MDEKLEPCAFCGGEDSRFIRLGYLGADYSGYRECLSCTASGPVASDDSAAIVAWNLRSSPWRPLGEPTPGVAPWDGTWVLGWAKSDSAPYRISWGRNHDGRLSWCTSFASFIDGYITHWQPLAPLPEPPAEEG